MHYQKHFHCQWTSEQPEAKDSAVSHFQVLMFHHIIHNLTQIGKVKYKKKSESSTVQYSSETTDRNHFSFIGQRSQLRRQTELKKRKKPEDSNIPDVQRWCSMFLKEGLHGHRAATAFTHTHNQPDGDAQQRKSVALRCSHTNYADRVMWQLPGSIHYYRIKSLQYI